jgi:hypothetical protein
VTVLDPTLFLSFINDLPEHVNCDVRFLEDDCLLYRNVNNQSIYYDHICMYKVEYAFLKETSCQIQLLYIAGS